MTTGNETLYIMAEINPKESVVSDGGRAPGARDRFRLFLPRKRSGREIVMMITKDGGNGLWKTSLKSHLQKRTN